MEIIGGHELILEGGSELKKRLKEGQTVVVRGHYKLKTLSDYVGLKMGQSRNKDAADLKTCVSATGKKSFIENNPLTCLLFLTTLSK